MLSLVFSTLATPPFLSAAATMQACLTSSLFVFFFFNTHVVPPNYGGNPTLYSGNNEVRCLIRKVLLQTLANELPQGTIKYSSKVVHIEELGDLKLVRLDGSIVKATVLIGCDGVNSVVAKWLKLSKPVHTQRAAARGIADFPGGHGLEPKMF